MGCLWRKTLSVFLVFVTIYLHEASSQEAAPAGPRKPFFERLRRLEEQFRRFQAVTLTHLQSVASNYNVSYNVDVRFRSLAEESQAVAQAVNQSQAVVQGELVQLKAWVRKLQRRSRKIDMRLRALDLALGERSQQQARERKAHEAQGDALQDSLARLEGLVHSQGARLAALEGWLPVAHPGITALGPALVPAPTQPGLLGPSSLKLQRDRQELQAACEHRGPRQDSSAPLQGTREPPGSGSHRVLNGTATAPKDPPRQAWSPRGPGEICGVGPTLVFPNASTKNVVFLSPGFVTALRAMSFCSWVRTASGHLGTLLSYATEDNDNKLVLHGRDSLLPGSIHFVIGDPAFRELPLQPLLDGQWHHICVIWTSTQGSTRFSSFVHAAVCLSVSSVRLRCLDGPHFISPFICWWTSGLFSVGVTAEKVGLSTLRRVFVWTFFPLRWIPRSRITGRMPPQTLSGTPLLHPAVPLRTEP
ncbi:pentraxin-4 isoform X2 [Macaca mulatta]